MVDWAIVTRRNIPWRELESLQTDLVASVLENPSRGFLLFSEPSPTFTHGISAKPTDRHWNDDECASRGISVATVSRGGKWTYHGPGQILVYPIVSLQTLGFDSRSVARFLVKFRQSVKEGLSQLEMATGGQDSAFGLYSGNKKLVSFGVAIPQGICQHGAAIYLEDQSTRFGGITPCGVAEAKTVSLRELGWTLDWEATAYQLADSIKKRLKAHVRPQ